MGKPCRVITVGNSLAVTLPAQLCRLLAIERPMEMEATLVEGCIVYRPIRMEKAAPNPVGRVQRYRELEGMLQLLDMHGLLNQHFERLSHEKIGLLEFAGRVGTRHEVDPLTVQRLQRCLERRTTLRESWDATIDAVLDEFPSPP